jgi:chromosome segregation ATPase
MVMSPDVIGYVLGALLTTFAAIYAKRASVKASAMIAANRERVEEIRADGEAYRLAQAINREMVEDLRAEIDRMQMQVALLRTQLNAEVERSSHLSVTVQQLEITVARLRGILLEHELPVPEGL